MTIALLILSVLLALAVHERARVLAYRLDNIPIVAAGLGLAYPPMLRRRIRGITWTLSPWLIAAYVEPLHAATEAAEKTLPYRRLAWHWNAGIWANMLTGFAAAAVASLIHGAPGWALICTVLAVALWFGRYAFAAYIAPLLGPVMLAFFLYGAVMVVRADWTQMGFGGLGGLVPASVGTASAVTIFAQVSLLIACANLLPLMPLDNGRPVAYLAGRISPRLATGVEYTGSALIWLCTVLVLGSDAVRIVATVF